MRDFGKKLMFSANFEIFGEGLGFLVVGVWVTLVFSVPVTENWVWCDDGVKREKGL